jgi:microcystin-dependent protein
MTIPTAVNYPTSLDDDNTLFADPVNNLSLTLAADIDNAETAVAVTGPVELIEAPCFLAFATGELVYAESWDPGTNTFTVLRGTSPVAHTAGETLRLAVAAEYFNQLKKAVLAIETTLGLSPHGTATNVAERVSTFADNLATAQAAVDALEVLADNVQITIEPGSIFAYAGITAPTGYLECDGSEISRSTYAELFAAIGTTFGTGDGSTTFNLPDMRGRVAVGTGQGAGLTSRNLGDTGGEEEHLLTVAEIPLHSHSYTKGYLTTSGTLLQAGGTPFVAFHEDTAQNTQSGGSDPANAHNNMMPFVAMMFIIKV